MCNDIISENPFNYDLNDLGEHTTSHDFGLLADFISSDLDQFCLAVQRELHEVTAVRYHPLIAVICIVLTVAFSIAHDPRPRVLHLHGMEPALRTRRPPER